MALFLMPIPLSFTVFARRRQIGIMKFVGATDWFIRWPFILEGIFLGLLGALTAYLVLFYVSTGICTPWPAPGSTKTSCPSNWLRPPWWAGNRSNFSSLWAPG